MFSANMKHFLALSFLNFCICGSFGQFILPGIRTVDGDYSDYDSNAEYKSSFRLVDDLTEKKNVVEISEDAFLQLNSAPDLKSLHALLGIKEPVFENPIEYDFKTTLKKLSTRIGDLGDGDPEVRSKKTDTYIANPEQAFCGPEIKSVELGLVNTPEVIYYPTCVRIKQCGGCCPKKHLFSCQPIATEKVFVKVMKLNTKNNANEVSSNSARIESRRRRRRKSVQVKYESFNVTVEEHKDCNCMCKFKESECDASLHLYDKHNCACVCKNVDDEIKCFEKHTHVWSDKSCQCLCRKVLPCSSNQEFDHKTCSCRLRSSGFTFSWDAAARSRSSDPGVAILFPDANGNFNSPRGISARPSVTEVPKDNFEEEVNSLSSIEDFAKYFSMELPAQPNVTISVRIKNAPVETKLDQAHCVPELHPVTLDLPKEKGVTYFPTCVRVPRCGGCCFLSYHSCQPTKIEKIMVKTVRIQEQVTMSRRRRVRNAIPDYVLVEVNKHVECDCKCKLQESQCNADLHVYDQYHCVCQCKNQGEETACFESGEHYWHNDLCQCLCRVTRKCSTGFVFDHVSCRCKQEENSFRNENILTDIFS